MEVVHARCAGLDVHKDTVVACARLVKGRLVEQKVETFRTTSKELLRLSDWLTERGCTHVAMESTGVFWKPVWHVLEGSFELVLANATAIRNLPGRKTDVSDAQWLQRLHSHGLCEPAFDRRVRLLNYAPICVNASACWTTPPPISSICRSP